MSVGRAKAYLVQPRLLRLRDAPGYLGLDKNVFNRELRPGLSEIRFGRAVLFDRLELDAWADYTLGRCRLWKLEDRKPLLGHTTGEITTHYSEPDLARLIECAELVCERRQTTILRVVGQN